MRIIGFPTATPTADDYFLMDSVEDGARAVSATQLANALFAMANQVSGSGGTPVGEIISYMGVSAPTNYLICDGAEYNIEDYPLLSQHFLDHFGSVDHFGGDGEVTFAVPDLRGEFLRGTGTATRNSGSGSAVGDHQQATIIQNSRTNVSNVLVYTNKTDAHIGNYDKVYTNATGIYEVTGTFKNSEVGAALTVSTRPTNTSVLYCIKYQ